MKGGCVAVDEIDAIGKARSAGASDSGTQEREQGLLQMLCELDGFKKNSKVCFCHKCCALGQVLSKAAQPHMHF